MYGVIMLVIMAGAYLLDEQSRVQSFGKFMSLQDQNAELASNLVRWKAFPERPPDGLGTWTPPGKGDVMEAVRIDAPIGAIDQEAGGVLVGVDAATVERSRLSPKQSPLLAPAARPSWHHIVLEDPADEPLAPSESSHPPSHGVGSPLPL